MVTHTAKVEWQRQGEAFVDRRYSRAHRWSFDGGASVPASSSPHVVKAPFSNPANVDPEEGLVAALSSCHMLWFLDLAARHGFRIDRYVDAAEGRMARNAAGKEWMAEVTLKPDIAFSGPKVPTDADVEALHHEAHAECFIANSVRSTVRTEATWSYQPGEQ
jgi:organic hydroperoxide reductase OsmC/OhrA